MLHKMLADATEAVVSNNLIHNWIRIWQERFLKGVIAEIMSSLLAIFVSLIGLSVVLVACTGQDVPTTPTLVPTSVLEGIEIVKTIPPTTEGDEPEPLNPEGPRRGGVLAAPLSWCPIHDPAIDSALGFFGINSVPLVTEIHAGLTRLSDDANAPIQLELAESYSVLENGLLYEFVLRQDLKFSDASPLTASDVKWSWERALKLSGTAGRARDVFGLIDGASAVIEGGSSDLTGLTVVDDRTFKARLTHPRAEFISLLADPVASVLNQDNVLRWMTRWEGDGSQDILGQTTEDNLPVGAGPFKLIDYWIGSEPGHCAIARNPHYWGRPAYLGGVWFRTEVMKRETENVDGETHYSVGTDPMAFVQEETDFEQTAFLPDGSAIGDVPDEFIEVDGAEILRYELPATISFFVLNPSAPPFDDVRFRRALAASSDVESATWYPGDTPRLITVDVTTLPLEDNYVSYDPDVAKTELAGSKYAQRVDRWEIGFLQAENWGLAYDFDLIFDQWSELLNVDVRTGHFDHAVIDNFGRRNNDGYHIRLFHQGPAYPDPSTVLRAIDAPFGEIGKAPEFVKVEEMMNAAAVELDLAKRHEMYLEIENYLAEQALVVPIEVFPSNEHYRVQPWVHDLKPPKYPGSVFHNVWLDHRAPNRELPLP